MNCPKCGSANFRAWVEIGMYVDAADVNNISKDVIRKKSTELWSKNPEAESYICRDCYYHIPSLRRRGMEATECN